MFSFFTLISPFDNWLRGAVKLCSSADKTGCNHTQIWVAMFCFCKDGKEQTQYGIGICAGAIIMHFCLYSQLSQKALKGERPSCVFAEEEGTARTGQRLKCELPTGLMRAMEERKSQDGEWCWVGAPLAAKLLPHTQQEKPRLQRWREKMSSPVSSCCLNAALRGSRVCSLHACLCLLSHWVFHELL